MHSVQISEALGKRLADWAHKTHRSESSYAEEALERFLEDAEDYSIAMERLEAKGPRTSLAEAKRQLGFSDE